MTDQDLYEPYRMRKPCGCGCDLGVIRSNNGQDTVWCRDCGKWQYNAPKTETGKPQRHVKTREGIKPSQRARILFDRANGACEICHTASTELHVGHLIPLEKAVELGFTEDELNSDENLAAMCETCNLGLGKQVVPLRLVVGIQMARIRIPKSPEVTK